MRIVAGMWGGRQLHSPGSGVRPTQDRVRQILFDILGESVAEGPVLDLYAGTGALGLEAVSRGAPGAVLVEAEGRARRVLDRNCRDLEAGDRVRILGMRTLRALRLLSREGRSFRWILADPPYDNSEVSELLEFLGAEACALLSPGGALVLECRAPAPWPAAAGLLRRYRERVAGDTALCFYRRIAAAQAGENR